jgi:hypothetical protein
VGPRILILQLIEHDTGADKAGIISVKLNINLRPELGHLDGGERTP